MMTINEMYNRAIRKTETARRNLETARCHNNWAREQFWREMLVVRIKRERMLRGKQVMA